jgi:hypothetical protein
MSVEATTWAWAWPGLSSTQRLVLVRIADHAAPDGSNAWPSLDRLVVDTCLSRRSVQRAVADLEAMGALVVEYKAGPHGVNRYSVRRSDGATVATSEAVDNPPDGATVSRCQVDTVTVWRRDVVTGDTERGHSDTQTIRNHPEPSSSPHGTGRGDEDDVSIVDQVVQAIARIRLERAQTRQVITDPVRWRAAVAGRLRRDGTPERIAELAGRYPTAAAGQIAAYLEGETRALALLPRAS